MKKFKILLFVVFINFLNLNANAKIEVDARHVILLDHLSGEVLYEKEADGKIYPASMTKIMTSIIAFDLLKKGETTLDELITVSENAWRMSSSGYSSMFIMLNDNVSVEDLLRGIIIASGNDACVALAEGLAGTEKDFAILMNEKAEEIGMTNTSFANSSGISDPNNYSTVRDIALMSKYLIDNYPEYYLYFKEKDFTWERTGGDPIKQGNRNPLLYKNIGVDGIKTGFLTVEKYSLASSMISEERRLISVGSGFPTKNIRSTGSAKILNWGLRTFDTIRVADKTDSFTKLDVWMGKKHQIDAFVKDDFYVTIPKRKKNTIKAFVEYEGPIEAPIKKDQKIGVVYVLIKDELIKELNLYARDDVDKLNIFARLFKYFNYLVWGDV
jgi:D-alanyl-D-alanine carboxypeptidase (penicillin-binding protein 5/6)